MRIVKHGLTSIIRRPIKTTMLFLIFLVVFNLVFTGVITQNSITSSKNYIRNQIGGVVEYQTDYTSFYQDLQNGELPEDAELPPISLEQVREIGKNDEIASPIPWVLSIFTPTLAEVFWTLNHLLKIRM